MVHRAACRAQCDGRFPIPSGRFGGSDGDSKGVEGNQLASSFSNLLSISRVLIPPFVGSNPATPAINAKPANWRAFAFMARWKDNGRGDSV